MINNDILGMNLDKSELSIDMSMMEGLDWLHWFVGTHKLTTPGGERRRQYAQMLVKAMIKTLSQLSESDAQWLIASGINPYGAYRLRHNRHIHGFKVFHIATIENSAFGDGKRVIVTSLGHRLLIEEFNDFAEEFTN